MAVSSLLFLEYESETKAQSFVPLSEIHLEVTPGFEPGVRVLQTLALPLGYVTIIYIL